MYMYFILSKITKLQTAVNIVMILFQGKKHFGIIGLVESLVSLFVSPLTSINN